MNRRDRAGSIEPVGHEPDRRQRYNTTVIAVGRRVLVPVPFDPDDVWGAKPRHHVPGTVDGMRVRGVVEPSGTGAGFVARPGVAARLRGRSPATTWRSSSAPKGPQREDLAPDVAAALDAHPRAGAFFDSLAQFYRAAYLRWIDATKRRPGAAGGADRRDGRAAPGGHQAAART